MARRSDRWALWGLSVGSLAWVAVLRLGSILGHARARARVAIRHEGHADVLGSGKGPRMWFHVSSLGELEQAIPVMQAHRDAHPQDAWLRPCIRLRLGTR